jgi:hypothetical protein
MAEELGEEAFDGDRQRLEPAELRHVPEDVRGVQPLPFDLDLRFADDGRGDALEDILRRLTLAQQATVTVHCARAQALAVARQVQVARATIRSFPCRRGALVQALRTL